MTGRSSGAEVHRVAALIHGRYLVETPEPAGHLPEGLLVGFHGYGETAEDHLAELARIPERAGWALCAIQGLHPFYRGRTGEVVASWMTSLDREWAIEDNVRYVASVVALLRRRFPEARKLVFAGFSQGVAMAYRAAAGCGFPSHGLIALAGDIPPEVAARRPLGLPPVLLGRGAADEWYSEEKMATDLERLSLAGVPSEPVVFEGGHEWGGPFLAAAARFLGEIEAE